MTTKLVEETPSSPKRADAKKHASKPTAKPPQVPKKAAAKPAAPVALPNQRRSAAVSLHSPTSSPALPSPALALRRALGLSQPEFARLFPVSLRTLVTIESGAKISETHVRRLNELSRLMNALVEVIRKDSLGPWLKQPNPAFDGLKPVDVIERGEVDRIWSMIYFLRSGVSS